MPFADPVSRTARLTAAARARETRRPDRLFEDPWAELLAGPEGFALMKTLEQAAAPAGSPAPPENPYIAIRTRVFDTFLTTAVTKDSAGALPDVVLMAAGLDTRAFRLDWPVGTRVFELDRPDVLGAKNHMLETAGARPRCDRRTIAADLAAPWTDALLAAGFDAKARSVWLVEGLFPYLDEAGVRGVLTQAASLASPGSQLRADVIGRVFFESVWTQAYLETLDREQASWKFGTDEPEAFFAAAGWHATVVRPGEDGANFGRWPYPVAPRGTLGVPTTFLVSARR
jgi:methyltransferase (TIGR00027 family)